MDRALSNDAAQYFKLQFRSGEFKIRKEDRRVDMCQALAIAGLGPNSTTSFLGPSSPIKGAKPRRRERRFINLKKAITIAQQKKIPDLVAALQNFSNIYEAMALERGPKTGLLTVDERDNGVTDGSEEVSDTQWLDVESYRDSRSSSITPGPANSLRAVTPNDHDADATSNTEVAINVNPGEDDLEFALPEEQSGDEAFTTMVKVTADLERKLTDPSYMAIM